MLRIDLEEHNITMDAIYDKTWWMNNGCHKMTMDILSIFLKITK